MTNTLSRAMATAAMISALFLQGCSLLSPQPVQSVESLAARIQKHIEQPRFSAAQWGIQIVSLETGRTLFRHNADKYFIPASNTKLYTGALALEAFAPDTRIPTRLYITAPLDSEGVVNGDLVLYGQGDPTFDAAEETGAVQHPFDVLAAQLAQMGVKHVRGHLVVNNRYFRTPPIGTDWQADDLQWGYGAEVSALTISENTFTLTVKPATAVGQPGEITQAAAWIKIGGKDHAPPPVKIINRTATTAASTARRIGLYRAPGSGTLYVFGSLALNDAPAQYTLALPHPAEAVGHALQTALKKYRISVDGALRTVDGWYREPQRIPEHWIPLVQLESPSLADLLKQTLKRSQNLYAQDLLLQIGHRTSETTPAIACAQDGPACTTEQWGLYALNQFLPQIGIALHQVRLREGSGLSRHNLVTPAATVTLLRAMDRHPAAQIFKDALPVAGVDGTLADRMKGTAAQNNARAKTGALQYVYTLSGYVATAAQEPLAFSIMLNNYAPPETNSNTASVPTPTEDIDAIVIQLAKFRGRT